MELFTILGLTAGMLTTVSFLPQVIKTWKMRETKDISLLMYIVLCTGIILWIVYGILIKDLPLIVANSFSLILASIILFFKIKYNNG